MKFLIAALCLLATTLTVKSAGPSLRLRYTNKNPPPLQTYSAHLHNDLQGSSPVYGGVPAEDIAEAPFQAALFANKAFFCSGGIIAKDWVITAGHCADARAKGDVDVQVGSIRLAPEAADTYVQKVTTSAADRILHPDFNMDFLDNDIALIKLPQDLKLTPHIGVQALRLPTYADTTNKLTDTKVQINGWGRISDDGAGPSVWPVLQIAYIKITDDKECENIYGNAMIGTKICATTKDEGVSTCSGDSGGAVVEFLHGKFVLHGITSFGSNRGCTIGRPVVFTRVSSFLEFIETTTGLPIND